MKKIKLYAIGNEVNFNYYIFDKKQEVIEILSKLLYDTLKLNLDLHEDKGKNFVRKNINFEKLCDKHQGIWSIGKKQRADIFYGNKKIFLTIYCSLKLKEKFNAELERVSIFPKAKNKPINFKLK